MSFKAQFCTPKVLWRQEPLEKVLKFNFWSTHKQTKQLLYNILYYNKKSEILGLDFKTQFLYLGCQFSVNLSDDLIPAPFFRSFRQKSHRIFPPKIFANSFFQHNLRLLSQCRNFSNKILQYPPTEPHIESSLKI